MTGNESSLVLELWLMFKEYVPVKNRQDVADHYGKILADHDIYLNDLDDVAGEDNYLDNVIRQQNADDGIDEEVDNEDSFDEEWN